MRARLVAEVGSNHNGSLIRAAKLIDSAAEAGFWGVKFQQLKVEQLFRREALAARPELMERKKFEMDLEWHDELSKRAHEKGLMYGVTPFYSGCLSYLADRVDFFKLSSYQLLDRSIPTLVAAEGLPVILSTGMATMKECQEAVTALRAFGAEDLTLLHCVSSYPAPTDECNLAAIASLRKEFKCKVGWSDHTGSPTVVRAAIWRWDAELVELHFDLEDQAGAESKHSWTPRDVEALEGWMHDLPSSELKQFDGHGSKIPARCELEERKWRSDPSDGLRPVKGTL